jgi:hypothetical protein
MKDFLNTKTARVYYDETLDTLFLEYIGKVLNDEQFIAINTEVLSAFKKLSTQKFVADIRKMGIISIASQEWVLKNLLPGMIKHLKGRKLFHAQLLDPSEVMAKVSGVNIKNKAKTVADDFEVIQFTNESEMRDYLRNFNAPS